jgi:molybdate transport system substrate-binding protein
VTTLRRALAGPAIAALLLPLAACGNDDAVDPRADVDATLTVFAAASLKGTFTTLAKEFEERNDGVTVQLSFAGSSDLVSQISEGAPADVLASADEKTMDTLVGDDLVDGEPTDFATNTLVIVTPPDDPGGVTSLADLAKPDLDVVVCAPQVPCGNAAKELASKAGVTLAPDSEEQSVTDVLGKVTSGEADAGLVYVTDAKAAGKDVDVVEVPEADEVVNTYPIAVLADAKQPGLARDWVGFVTGKDGQAVLRKAGFGKP